MIGLNIIIDFNKNNKVSPQAIIIVSKLGISSFLAMDKIKTLLQNVCLNEYLVCNAYLKAFWFL